jgi:hypothetical protein
MPDYRYQLPPDPAPREVARGDGSNRPLSERTKPASPIAPAPSQSLSAQRSEAREEITLLRSTLHGVGTSLRQLADQLGHDVAEAEAKARIEADIRRRFQ